MKFSNNNHLSLKINEQEYIYANTRDYKDTTYLQCISRKKGASTNQKCLAKANYDSLKQDVVIVGLHNPNCSFMSEEKIKINCDFQSQKDEIVNELNNSKSLSVVGVLDMLRDKKTEGTLSKRRFLLKYTQVKKILQQYRQENKSKSNMSYSDTTLLKTVDGALFRRCHKEHRMLDKSKYL